MSVTTRVVAAAAVLLAAAIPVGALSLKGTSSPDFGAAARDEAMGAAAANDASRCGSDCIMLSQLVPQSAGIEGDDIDASALPEGTTRPVPRATVLVPQNPTTDAVSEPEDVGRRVPAETGAVPTRSAAAAPPEEAAPAPAATPKKAAKRPKQRRAARQAKKQGSLPGSWQLLLQGK